MVAEWLELQVRDLPGKNDWWILGLVAHSVNQTVDHRMCLSEGGFGLHLVITVHSFTGMCVRIRALAVVNFVF